MKTANEMPQYKADRFTGLVYPVLEAQLVYSALELNLFKQLSAPKTAEETASAIGCHQRNTLLLLNALVSVGYLIKEDGRYKNTPETDYYLNPESEMYIGDNVLYWRDMTNLNGLTSLVKNGPEERIFTDENGSDMRDFRAMGQSSRNVLYAGRIQQFIQTVKKLFKPDDPIKVLDMGCGSGLLSIEIARNFKHAHVTAFDQPQVVELTNDIIKEYGVEAQVQTRAGNFVTDDIGSDYDFIIASAVINFAGDLPKMAEKIKHALKDTGLFYVTTHKMNDDMTEPSVFLLGWLSSHLNGLDVLKPDSVIKSAFYNAGFEQMDIECDDYAVILSKK